MSKLGKRLNVDDEQQEDDIVDMWTHMNEGN